MSPPVLKERTIFRIVNGFSAQVIQDISAVVQDGKDSFPLMKNIAENKAPQLWIPEVGAQPNVYAFRNALTKKYLTLTVVNKTPSITVSPKPFSFTLETSLKKTSAAVPPQSSVPNPLAPPKPDLRLDQYFIKAVQDSVVYNLRQRDSSFVAEESAKAIEDTAARWWFQPVTSGEYDGIYRIVNSGAKNLPLARQMVGATEKLVCVQPSNDAAQLWDIKYVDDITVKGPTKTKVYSIRNIMSTSILSNDDTLTTVSLETLRSKYQSQRFDIQKNPITGVIKIFDPAGLKAMKIGKQNQGVELAPPADKDADQNWLFIPVPVSSLSPDIFKASK